MVEFVAYPSTAEHELALNFRNQESVALEWMIESVFAISER